ncbi:hypothetical protein BV20DRAFT_162536 [Pilatotrama ljubarskyi]|nr:hypothetical protein BV20DRAFT_162536 [Pilatotrama ljubarskyi]
MLAALSFGYSYEAFPYSFSFPLFHERPRPSILPFSNRPPCSPPLTLSAATRRGAGVSADVCASRRASRLALLQTTTTLPIPRNVRTGPCPSIDLLFVDSHDSLGGCRAFSAASWCSSGKWRGMRSGWAVVPSDLFACAASDNAGKAENARSCELGGREVHKAANSPLCDCSTISALPRHAP